MKAKPVKLIYGEGYLPCTVEEATHVQLNMPGPIAYRCLPVILKGSRDESHAWTWNGDTDKPTLRPSILTQNHLHRCHTWVNDGKAQFLDDCSHEQAGKTVELLDVEDAQ
jgi:hypothetical protein